MAIDPNLAPPSSEPGAVSIIENEIPAYRAISSAAIFCLILGVVSVLCFAHHYFLVVAVAAIVLGVIALRQIDRRSDVLTGSSFAMVGITLGLVFGIASATSNVVQSMMLNRDASRFAEEYVEVLKNGSLASAIVYQQSPAYRKSKSAEEIVEELKKSGSQGPGGDPFTMQAAPINRIKEILRDKGEVHFAKIETSAVAGLTSYANALIEVHHPSAKEPAEKEAFGRIRLRKDSTSGSGEWTIEELEFPYKPMSYVEKVQPPDDGHGHGGH